MSVTRSRVLFLTKMIVRDVSPVLVGVGAIDVGAGVMLAVGSGALVLVLQADSIRSSVTGTTGSQRRSFRSFTFPVWPPGRVGGSLGQGPFAGGGVPPNSGHKCWNAHQLHSFDGLAGQ